MRTLLYQQGRNQIFWDDEGWLYVNWVGQQEIDDLKQHCEQMLRLLVARNTDSVLNDNTRVEGSWIGAAEWGAKDWFPRMRAAGLRAFAWVYSPSRFSQMSTNATLQAAQPDTAKVFASVAEATEFLRTQRTRRMMRTQRIRLPGRES